MSFSVGELVVCTERPGNMDIYPKMVGEVVHKKEIGATISNGKCTSNYVYCIKYPLKNDKPGPLDTPIKWMVVDAVPNSCLRAFSGMRKGFSEDNKYFIEHVAKDNSNAIVAYTAKGMVESFTISSNIFPSQAINSFDRSLKKFEAALGIKPQLDETPPVGSKIDIRTRPINQYDFQSMYPDVLNQYRLADEKLTAEIWNLIRPKERKDETMIIMPTPVKIIYNYPATTVIWSDKTKTTVKCSEDQEFGEYYGYLAALAKKIYKTNGTIERLIRDKREYGKQHEVRLHTKTIMVDMMNGESSSGPAVINYSCADAYRTYSGSMVSDDRPVNPDGEIDIRKNNNVPNEE